MVFAVAAVTMVGTTAVKLHLSVMLGLVDHEATWFRITVRHWDDSKLWIILGHR